MDGWRERQVLKRGRAREPGLRESHAKLTRFRMWTGTVAPVKGLTVLVLLSLAVLSQGATAADFPAPFNSQPSSPPMSPAEAAATARVPPGFRVSVFAAEPEVMNPLAMNWDSRGRLWVAENFTYSESLQRGQANSFQPALRDRIVVFEGGDGGDRFHTRKIFTDELQRVMSVAVGYGGVWVIAIPELLFIPDRDMDGVPDGRPEVVLDGFNITGLYHTVANGLHFGPDGWLYGRCGHSNHGAIGRPGTPVGERTPLRGSLWRYHPLRRTFEALSAGTVNPWGHDWDRYGELFFVNTIIGHLWHQIPGAHYQRSTSRDPNPWAYEAIDQHADHFHFQTDLGWSKSKGSDADRWGGGHAAVGAMIYQGDNWPAEYRDRLYMLNLFGHRMNCDILERQGSGYVARHGPDVVTMADPWFRGLALNYGPDGGVFVADWSDTGEYTNRDGVHRTSGRIFKITHGEARASAGSDLTRLGTDDLVRLHTHANEWFARQARLELVRRQQNGQSLGRVREQLLELDARQNDAALKLRVLWTLHNLRETDEAFLRLQLKADDEHIRAWAIRLLTDAWPLDTVISTRPAPAVAGPEATPDPALLHEFTRMAAEDDSGLVRLVLASTLQRLPIAQRLPLASTLAARSEDANDHNLPLMLWYGLIPVAKTDLAALATLAGASALPTTRKYIARRLAEEIERTPEPLNELIANATTKATAFQSDVLEGIAQALNGVASAQKPWAWDALARVARQSASPAIRNRLLYLNVIFGQPGANEEARMTALDATARPETRRAALQALFDRRAPELRFVAEQLLAVPSLELLAARALATFDEPEVAAILVNAYDRFDSSNSELIAVLTSRTVFARALLEAVAAGKIPRTALTPYALRQIRSLNDVSLHQQLATLNAGIPASGTTKEQLLAKYKQRLTPDVLRRADKGQGRMIFQNVCAGCHTLYGEGGKIGPDLTGGNRQNIDYLLRKIVDPSAQISPDYRLSIARLKDGRVVTGVVAAQANGTTTFKTLTETITVPDRDIANIEASSQSLMPEGLFEALSADQTRDLVGYLIDATQVPLPGK